MTYRTCLDAVVLGILSVVCVTPAFAGPQPPAGWTDGYVVGQRHPHPLLAHRRRPANRRSCSRTVRPTTGCAGRTWRRRSRIGYDIIMFDARGHGLSDPPTAADPADVQVEDLAGLIRELKLDRPVLMGHSMGSTSVAHFAAKYPDVPRAVILEDPALVPSGYAAGDVHGRAAECRSRNVAATILARNNTHRSDTRGGLHEELAEVGAVGVRDLGALEAPASSPTIASIDTGWRGRR